jgi:hypothetical protein
MVLRSRQPVVWSPERAARNLTHPQITHWPLLAAAFRLHAGRHVAVQFVEAFADDLIFPRARIQSGCSSQIQIAILYGASNDTGVPYLSIPGERPDSRQKWIFDSACRFLEAKNVALEPFFLRRNLLIYKEAVGSGFAGPVACEFKF